jgi:hypothetical protein
MKFLACIFQTDLAQLSSVSAIKKGSIPEILVSVSRAQTHRAAQRIHIADRGVLSMREREARARFLIQGPSKKEQAHCSSYK